jgi:hypothetical protein
MDAGRNAVYGYVDGIEAMKQAIYLALGVERYRHAILSRNYGVELIDLIGEPMPYVLPEIQRRVTEALLADSRVLDVDGFEFIVGRGAVTASFAVTTVYGQIAVEKTVAV